MAAQYSHPSLLNLGFRPFFTGASVFAIISIAYWWAYYQALIPLNLSSLTPFQWHAHEMIYGYSVAVIAGFLLTAVKNWTGKQTPHGYPLALLFVCWVAARILWFFGEQFLFIAALFDLLFMSALMVVTAWPIIECKQWRQLAVLSKLILLGAGNLIFYLSASGYIENAIHLSIYGGLYLVIGLILTIGRRIIPLFVERGVDYPVTLFNSRWLDISSLLGFLAFFISELFLNSPQFSTVTAGLMFVITSIRIVGWYTSGIWKNPLLWCFYIALLFIDLGFLLFALSPVFHISPFLATHAFAAGGIGVMTMGMMARVSIGHTGRNLKVPPRLLFYALVFLGLSALTRVLLPVIFTSTYSFWVSLSGLLWLVGFVLFCRVFLPIWNHPRVDQKYG